MVWGILPFPCFHMEIDRLCSGLHLLVSHLLVETPVPHLFITHQYLRTSSSLLLKVVVVISLSYDGKNSLCFSLPLNNLLRHLKDSSCANNFSNSEPILSCRKSSCEFPYLQTLTGLPTLYCFLLGKFLTSQPSRCLKLRTQKQNKFST